MEFFEQQARRLNEAFITYKTERRPFGILKIAMTLDAKIATKTRESKWITSEESRHLVHQLRHRADALVTGSGTVMTDNPQLTDRSGLSTASAFIARDFGQARAYFRIQ